MKKRWLLLIAVFTAILVWRLVTPPELAWSKSGELELGASPAEVAPYLADLGYWPDWLIWREHPFPKWQTKENNGYPAALILDAHGETLTRVTLAQNTNALVSVSLNQPDEAIAGQCLFELFETRKGSDLEWQCSGRYSVSTVNEIWLQFGFYPEWPFDLQASLRRLQLRFE